MRVNQINSIWSGLYNKEVISVQNVYAQKGRYLFYIAETLTFMLTTEYIFRVLTYDTGIPFWSSHPIMTFIAEDEVGVGFKILL